MDSIKRNFKNTNKALISILVLFLVMGILWGVLFMGIMSNKKEITELLKQTAELKNREDDESSLAQLIEGTKEDRAELDLSFVAPKSIVKFIEKIEDLGSTSGVKLDLTSVDISSELDTLSIRFSSEGDWNESIYFLSLLEALPLRLEFEKVYLIKVVEKDKASYWRGNFEVFVLSYLDEEYEI